MGKRKNKGRSPGWSKPRAANGNAPKPKRGPLDVPRPETTRPPVFLDAQGRMSADPLEVLGFEPGATPSRGEVSERARELLVETPPERDAARAREILEARARLNDASGAPERLWGELRVPDPKIVLPGVELSEANGAADQEAECGEVEWPAQSRLAGLMALYALVEVEIERAAEASGDVNKQGELF